jgi:hypothetical protein
VHEARTPQLVEATELASSAAARAAFSAEVEALFCATGSGGPAFCIAGLGCALTRRSATATAGSIGRESTGRTVFTSEPVGFTKRNSAQTVAAARRSSTAQRQAMEGTAVIAQRSCGHNVKIVKRCDAYRLSHCQSSTRFSLE